MHSLRREYVDEYHAHTDAESHDQILCFNCEEMVSRSAQSCPYCRIKLASTHSQSKSTLSQKAEISKITPFQSSTIEKNRLSSTLLQEPQPYSIDRASYSSSDKNGQRSLLDVEHTPYKKDHSEFQNSSQSTASYLISLLFFLLGGAFLFFGIGIFLFAKDGSLILCWNESLWMPFIGCGLALLCTGYLFLSRIESYFEDI